MSKKLGSAVLYKLVNNLYNRQMCKRKLHLKFDNSAVKQLESPFLVVVNHCSMKDVYCVAATMKPHVLSFVTAIDQVAEHPLYAKLGAIPKRVFVSQVSVIREIKRRLSAGRSVAVFPEGKLSVEGRTGIIPVSTAKLVKLIGVPVVAVKLSGAYLTKPRWAQEMRKCEIMATASLILTREECAAFSTEEVHSIIVDALSNDDYKWQRDNRVMLDSQKAAEGLHTILYKCPNCGKEFDTDSLGDIIRCNGCNASWQMDEYGVLHCNLPTVDIDSVTAWYDYQRNAVADEVARGEYGFTAPCSVRGLEDKKYVDLGAGTFTHNVTEGIVVTLKDRTLHFPPHSTYTLSFDVGKRVILSDSLMTYKIEFTEASTAKQLTKLNLAVEEIFTRLQQDAQD